MKRMLTIGAVVISAALLRGCEEDTKTTGGQAPGVPRVTGRDASYVATPQDVVERMLQLAKVGKDDVVYDLGCGDGRIVVTAAAKHGCKAAGFDTDPALVQRAKQNAEKQGVGALVTIEQKDVFSLDLSPATVVTLYMGRGVNRRLIPQLEKLQPGSRVVSHMYEIEGREPDDVVEMISAEDRVRHVIYLWTMPFGTKPAGQNGGSP